MHGSLFCMVIDKRATLEMVGRTMTFHADCKLIHITLHYVRYDFIYLFILPHIIVSRVTIFKFSHRKEYSRELFARMSISVSARTDDIHFLLVIASLAS